MNNSMIRMKLITTGLKYWQLARILGISEMTLYRRLREELPEDEQVRICTLIDEYLQNGGAKNGQGRN